MTETAKTLVGECRAAGMTVKESLAVVDLPKSTYYHQGLLTPSRRRRPLDETLCEHIRQVVEERPVLGYRKVRFVLNTQHGFKVNGKKVLRHMRAMGLAQPKRKSTGGAGAPKGLVVPTASNRYWEMDFTYTTSGSDGMSYLAAIVDGFDKEIVGDEFSQRCRAVEAIKALEMAVMNRFGGRVPEGTNLVLRVDRGSQFTAKAFRDAARTLRVRLEYAGVRCPDDKPYIESFFSHYKTEEVYRSCYGSHEQAKAGWLGYRAWHRNVRPHQGLGYKTPAQVAPASVVVPTGNSAIVEAA